MTEEEFESLVVDAINDLPERFLSRFDNLDILVQNEPDPDFLEGMEGSVSLYGLYEGISLVEREQYGNVLPDRITIFKGPLERDFPGAAQLSEQVRITVLHEIAHHFGISDDRLEELGL